MNIYRIARFTLDTPTGIEGFVVEAESEDAAFDILRAHLAQGVGFYWDARDVDEWVDRQDLDIHVDLLGTSTNTTPGVLLSQFNGPL